MQGFGNNSGFKDITAAELGAMLQQGDLRLVEVRARHGEAEPSGAGVPASHLLPQSAGCAGNVSEVRARHGENGMDKNAIIVFYCQIGGRSGQAAAFAAANGFAEVYNLQGGITAWAQAGLPIAS